MQFNIIFKTILEYIHNKFRFVHTHTFCKYRKKLRASPRVHLVLYVIVYVCVLFASFSSKSNVNSIVYTLMYVHIFGYLVNKLEIWWVYLSPFEKTKQKYTHN